MEEKISYFNFIKVGLFVGISVWFAYEPCVVARNH